MKMKMTLAAGALALAFAGQASAAIVNSANLGNNLILSVWDTASNTSFTAFLAPTMQSFLTGAGVTFGGTAAAPIITGADTTANNFSFSNAALTAYLSTANAAATVWSVVGATNAGGANGYGTSGLMTTLTTPGSAAGTTTTAMGNAMGFNGKYATTAAGLLAAGSNTVSVTAANGGLAYVGGFGNGMGNNFGSSVGFTNTAALGQSMTFAFLTPQAAGRGWGGTAQFAFANANGASTWTLGANGLTYAAVAPVPEPGEWLLMLSGLALIGFIATRRKEGSVSFA